MTANRPRTADVRALFPAKQRRRRDLARLPIEQKIRVLVEMQKVANDIRAATGRPKRRVWRVPE